MDHTTTVDTGPAQVRLSEAIQKRVAEFGETESVAERSLVQTDEGLRLWNAARAERLEASEKGNARPSVVRTGGSKTEVVELKPRTFTVRKFAPGEDGSQWGPYGCFDGDELIGMADIRPDTYEAEARQQLSEFLRNPAGAPHGRAQELLEGMIDARMSERGESRQFAEYNVIQSNEGKALWARARKDRMEFD